MKEALAKLGKLLITDGYTQVTAVIVGLVILGLLWTAIAATEHPAAWTQAVGSIIAILVAVVVTGVQHARDRAREQERADAHIRADAVQLGPILRRLENRFRAHSKELHGLRDAHPKKIFSPEELSIEYASELRNFRSILANPLCPYSFKCLIHKLVAYEEFMDKADPERPAEIPEQYLQEHRTAVFICAAELGWLAGHARNSRRKLVSFFPEPLLPVDDRFFWS